MPADLADLAELTGDLLAFDEAERLEIGERRQQRIEVVRLLNDVDQRQTHRHPPGLRPRWSGRCRAKRCLGLQGIVPGHFFSPA